MYVYIHDHYLKINGLLILDIIHGGSWCLLIISLPFGKLESGGKRGDEGVGAGEREKEQRILQFSMFCSNFLAIGC